MYTYTAIYLSSCTLKSAEEKALIDILNRAGQYFTLAFREVSKLWIPT